MYTAYIGREEERAWPRVRNHPSQGLHTKYLRTQESNSQSTIQKRNKQKHAPFAPKGWSCQRILEDGHGKMGWKEKYHTTVSWRSRWRKESRCVHSVGCQNTQRILPRTWHSFRYTAHRSGIAHLCVSTLSYFVFPDTLSCMHILFPLAFVLTKTSVTSNDARESCACTELNRMSPRVLSQIIRLCDYVIWTVSLYHVNKK